MRMCRIQDSPMTTFTGPCSVGWRRRTGLTLTPAPASVHSREAPAPAPVASDGQSCQGAGASLTQLTWAAWSLVMDTRTAL